MRESRRFSGGGTPRGQGWLRGLALALLMVVPMLAAATSVAAQDDIVVTMVTDTAGLGDQNFNDLAFRGGTQAAEDFGVTFEALESETPADYVRNLTQAAEQSTLTVAVGFLLAEALAEVAPQYPDKQFLFIDGVVEGDNIASVTFKEHQSSFLTGIIAGLTTKTGIVGYLGGQRIPPVIRYEVGWVSGVKSVNPNADVRIVYADTFNDPALGNEITLTMYNQGADIVQAAAGRTGVGSFDAAKAAGIGKWVVAADTDQSQLGAEYQLCVAQKGVDTAVYLVSQQVVEGNFQGGVQDLGLAEQGVDLTNVAASVSPDTVAVADAYKQAIIDGQITVPATDDELAAFQPTTPEQLGLSATPAETPVGSPVASPAASPAS